MTKNNNNNHHIPQPLMRRFFSLPTLLSFVVAVAFIFFLLTRFDLDWDKTWDNVRTMSPGRYLLALAAYYLSFVFRGMRWRLLATNAGIGDLPGAQLPSVLRASQTIVIGWFVNSVAWFRLGDAYRAYVFSEDSKVGFSWSLGTVLAERVVDMATVLVLLVVGVLIFSITEETSGTGYIVAAGSGMAFALVVLVMIMRGYGARLSSLLPHRIRSAYNSFHQGTIGSLGRGSMPFIFGFGVVGWILEVARMYLVVQALGLSIGIPHVLIVALGHAILSTVPTPGGVGAVEPGVTGLLMLGMVREDALSVALVDRSITYLSILIFGGLAFLIWHTARGSQSKDDVADTVVVDDVTSDT